MKKIFKSFAIFMTSAALVSSSFAFTTEAASTGINVQSRTKAEIIDYIDTHPFDTSASYDEQPNYKTAPYSAGKLSDSTLQSALNALNIVRYIAGIDEVSLSDNYNDLAQTGALVDAVNGQLSHMPSKPADMSDELYNKGYEGASSSNLGWGYYSPIDAVLYGWIRDEDSYNIDRVGHRRWCLNPSMKQTGFGMVSDFTAMYAFDNTFGYTENYGVCWPAQTMPVEFFDKKDPWSISMGNSVNASAVKVTLTRKKDSQKWVFSNSSADGYFNVNNEYYGQQGCIIFRPDNITYAAGDSFDVTIEGLSSPVSYTVDFIDLKPEESISSSDIKETVNFLIKKSFDADKIKDMNKDNKINVFDLLILKKRFLKS